MGMKNKGLRVESKCYLLRDVHFGMYVKVKAGVECRIESICWHNGEVGVSIADGATPEGFIFTVMHYDIEVEEVPVGTAELIIFDRERFGKGKRRILDCPGPYDGGDTEWAKVLARHAHNAGLPLSQLGLRLDTGD